MESMPAALAERNGFIERGGLRIIRGGLGEFLICQGETCIGVTRSYSAAMAFANGYAAGKNDSIQVRYIEVPPEGDADPAPRFCVAIDAAGRCNGKGWIYRGPHVLKEQCDGCSACVKR